MQNKSENEENNSHDIIIKEETSNIVDENDNKINNNDVNNNISKNISSNIPNNDNNIKDSDNNIINKNEDIQNNNINSFLSSMSPLLPNNPYNSPEYNNIFNKKNITNKINIQTDTNETNIISDSNKSLSSFHALILSWYNRLLPLHSKNAKICKSLEEIISLFDKINAEKNNKEDINKNNINNNINNTNNDNKNTNKYKIIDNDIKRTRVNERKEFEKKFEIWLKQLLVYYVETNKVPYKQGMNEIMAVFLITKIYDNSIELSEIYNTFTLFLDVYFTNYFYEKEIYAFKSSCAIIELLLKYHEPEIYNKLNLAFVAPEIYCTNWIFTCYTNKLSLDISLKLYDFIIYQRDLTIIYFLVISSLRHYKNEILSNELYSIVELVTKIKITQIAEAEKIMVSALKIREDTPYSLYILVEQMNIFEPKSKFVQHQYERINPKNFQIFPVFPCEVIYNCFPNIISCPTFLCEKFENLYHSNDWPKKGKCQLCINKHILSENNDKNNNNIENNINIDNNNQIENRKDDVGKLFGVSNLGTNYCLIDIRILNSEEELMLCGNLPRMKSFSREMLLNKKNKVKIEDEIIKFIDENSKNNIPLHIILLTNDTRNFAKYEEKLYRIKRTNVEKLQEKYGLAWGKEKELDAELVKKYLKSHKSESELIIEYDNFRNIVKALLSKGKQHISFAYGGYIDLHRLLSLFRVPLTGHSKNFCRFCHLDAEDFRRKKHNISEENFNLLNSCKANKIFSCTYNRTRNATIVISGIYIFIFTLDKDNNKGNNKIRFKISHKMDKTSILAIETKQNSTTQNIEKYLYSNEISVISFLYTLNNSLSNLVKITLDLFSNEKLNEFIDVCHLKNLMNKKNKIN